ncbi:endonuclease/exonuclease/phosphatase family protein [Actinoplanes sp. N902-109]|uniref:endonuclease/exonuclease/phosphatase family protein n=1 Tax=Actinoplanes sp. (strain N902-109) TaxID=649831 RepID=UPI0003293F1B|nr:endonuclease/exonuclease/phosphatase family protein [Actinoplanes sp. N902-109]AGL19877.1 endonuclease/exonuclease/phosphatase [Actinoplanes sp. N902-109]
MTVRLVTWNLKTGGSGGRLAAVVALLQRERPDLLALQELRDFQRHDGARMREVAAALGMTATLAPSAFGQPVAVLVRPPLTVARRATVRWRLHHAAAAVTVPTQAGPLTVVSTHLNPFRPYRRLREARWLAHRYAAPLTLIAGDLNSLDPGTGHTERLSRLPELYRRRHVQADGSADTRAIAAFTEAGFTDLWRTAGRGDGLTVPTSKGGGQEFSNAGMRLDYLLARPQLAARAVQARVIRGGEAEWASDHYPLAVTFDLSPVA